MKTQYSWLFNSLILNLIKRGGSYSLFTILTYVQGGLRSSFLENTLKESHENISSMIFQPHVTKFDQKSYSRLSFGYTGICSGRIFHWKQNHISWNKTVDVSKLFLAILDRAYDGPNICHFLWLQNVSIKIFWQEVKFCTPSPKKNPKNPNQKWIKCCMKAPFRQAF